jgi:hypothetical protein
VQIANESAGNFADNFSKYFPRSVSRKTGNSGALFDRLHPAAVPNVERDYILSQMRHRHLLLARASSPGMQHKTT